MVLNFSGTNDLLPVGYAAQGWLGTQVVDRRFRRAVDIVRGT